MKSGRFSSIFSDNDLVTLHIYSLLKLQNVKMDLSDAALNEGTNGMRLTKMSVKELKTVHITPFHYIRPFTLFVALWYE